MLETLFGSELRVRLFNLFLSNNNKDYSINEISKILGISSASCRKETEAMLNFGIIKEVIVDTEREEEKNIEQEKELELKQKKTTKSKLKTKANKKELEPLKKLKANRDFILYPEIEALLLKSRILSSQAFIIALEKNFQPKLLILSGFFTGETSSKTDLLIVGQIKKPSFLKIINDLENDLGREINFTIMDEEEFNYRKEIMDIFLHSILDGKKIFLIDKLFQA